jgi:hypothetical protein
MPPAPPAAQDAEAQFYSEPDRNVVARHAIEEAKREEEERKAALEMRRREAREEKQRVTEGRHRKTTLKMRGRGGGPRVGRPPWRKLALAGLAATILAVAVTSGDQILPLFEDGLQSLRARLIGGQAGPADPAIEIKTVVVRSDSVNVRIRASKTAPVVARLDRDTALPEVRRQGDWVMVTLPGSNRQGWVHSSLVSEAPGGQAAQ